MSVSEEIFKRMADSYRRMRNTLALFARVICDGFEPQRRTWSPSHDLVAIDQWIIAKAFTLQNDIVTAYRNYELPRSIYQKRYIIFAWSSWVRFYLDIIKDRLYTTGLVNSAAAPVGANGRCHHVAQAMVRWLAPILSFTAEEAWKFLT